jgi:DNA-binding transcriptional ArsR family regulator
MLDALISSKTRIKLLLKFFLNSNMTAYLRGLEAEFGESSNAIRLELNRFEQAGMITSRHEGNKKLFFANTSHPLFTEIHNILLKHLGLDRLVEEVIQRLGAVDKVYLSGSFARGIDSDVIDLVLIGDVDKSYLVRLVERVELHIQRKVRFLIYSAEEAQQRAWQQQESGALLLWSQ